MKPRSPHTLIAASLACALLAFSARAEDNAQAPQQTYHEHFAACAHQSKGLHGEEHHRFMSECLKDHGWQASQKPEPRKTSAEASTPQQHRMQSCNDEAARKNLHGDERRAFMSACLKG